MNIQLFHALSALMIQERVLVLLSCMGFVLITDSLHYISWTMQQHQKMQQRHMSSDLKAQCPSYASFLLTNSHFSPFMESESSLSCPQELATGPYPEPDKSSPQPHTHFLKIHFDTTVILSNQKLSHRVVSTNTLYSEGPGFTSRPRGQLSWLKFDDFPQSLQTNAGIVPKIRPWPLPSTYFPFINY
jgi:hypothetical protein